MWKPQFFKPEKELHQFPTFHKHGHNNAGIMITHEVKATESINIGMSGKL